MHKTILSVLFLTAMAAPAFAEAGYPVSGKWGQSTSAEQGPVDCGGLRVIEFNGDERTDSRGGVPGYRIRSVSAEGSSYRIVDEFTSGQISNGHVSYTLNKLDADHIVLDMQPGGTLKLQRCK
jgi:hypothetical protein